VDTVQHITAIHNNIPSKLNRKSILHFSFKFSLRVNKRKFNIWRK